MTAKRTTPNHLSSQMESSLCQFSFSDGRRCRMLRRHHPALCPFHAHAEQQLHDSHQLGSEISTTLTGDFLSAMDINFALGKLFTAVAQNRISARNARVLAHISQLLLHSVPIVKQEFKFGYTFDEWQRLLANGVPLSHPTQCSPATLNQEPALSPVSPSAPES